MKPILKIKNAGKSYDPHKVFDNLNAEFQSGQITVLYGPSGVGKSTLLRCLSLLETLDSGEIFIDDQSVAKDGTIVNEELVREKLGIVFQDFYLWDNKKVLENLTEALIYVKKLDKVMAMRLTTQISSELSIEQALLDRYPPELSRGQRQRIAIARTLLMEPEIILFDEPTASLDHELVSQLINILHLLKAKKKTIIIVTHDLAFAKNVGDAIVDFKDLCR